MAAIVGLVLVTVGGWFGDPLAVGIGGVLLALHCIAFGHKMNQDG